MVMKTPRATPRLRGLQSLMVLAGDRGPMCHKGSDIKQAQSQGQKPWVAERAGDGCTAVEGAFWRSGDHSPGLLTALVVSAPELADFCLCQRLEGK